MGIKVKSKRGPSFEEVSFEEAFPGWSQPVYTHTYETINGRIAKCFMIDDVELDHSMLLIENDNGVRVVVWSGDLVPIKIEQ